LLIDRWEHNLSARAIFRLSFLKEEMLEVYPLVTMTNQLSSVYGYRSRMDLKWYWRRERKWFEVWRSHSFRVQWLIFFARTETESFESISLFVSHYFSPLILFLSNIWRSLQFGLLFRIYWETSTILDLTHRAFSLSTQAVLYAVLQS
jgi:hypothetical protein